MSFTVNLVVPALPAHHREAVQELNTSVPVAASSADLADDFLAQFQVCFCLTNLLLTCREYLSWRAIAAAVQCLLQPLTVPFGRWWWPPTQPWPRASASTSFATPTASPSSRCGAGLLLHLPSSVLLPAAVVLRLAWSGACKLSPTALHNLATPSCPPAQADIRGVFAQVFCDFGPSFEVLDVDGERVQQLMRGNYGQGLYLASGGIFRRGVIFRAHTRCQMVLTRLWAK